MAAVRPIVVLVHGSYYSADKAASEGLQIRNDLASLGGISHEAVVVAFDWPSQRTLPNPIEDANEKARRAAVAGYHLARLLQALPAGSRVGLIGHSHGGLIVLSALHLLGGGTLDDESRPYRFSGLPGAIPALRLTSVVIATRS